VGKYRLDAHLGRGGMGDGWRAFDMQLGCRVALERLPPDLSVKADRRERFLREARVLASLRSPSLPVLYAAESLDAASGGDAHLVLEYVEGRTLAELLARGPLTAAEALPLFRELVLALASAHAAGVTHRDLKPANVIVRPAAGNRRRRGDVEGRAPDGPARCPERGEGGG
jgi:serine/threonine-protein kinase